MKKTYVLDTNVLLTDPSAIFSFEEHDVILPFTVFEELDKFKTRQDEIGANAREVTRELAQLIKHSTPGRLKTGIDTPNGGTIKVVSADGIKKTLPSELRPDKPDNVILSICLSFSGAVLVTNDLILRVLADSCGVKSEEYKKMSVAGSSATLYGGVKEMQVTKDDLQKLWQLSSSPEELSEHLSQLVPDCLPNEFVHIKNGSKNKPFVVRAMGDRFKFISEEFTIPKIKPRNTEQRLALELLMDNSVNLVSIIGKAGSGKTLMALAAGIEQVVDKKKYKSLIVLRPVQPLGKDIGFLPGTIEEKMEPWIAPIKDNLRFLLTEESGGRKTKNTEQSLNYYFDNGIIEVEAMTYIRGRSIANAYMIIDEAQNLSAHELKTIITRVGEGTKIVLTGDIEQIDNIYVDSVSNGLAVAVEKFKPYSLAGHITLRKGERSELASLASTIL